MSAALGRANIMSGYMPQYMFNLCAITAGRLAELSENTIEYYGNYFQKQYENDYDDLYLERDIPEAAKAIIAFVEKELPNASLPATLTQLQYSVSKYQPNGKKRKKKIFGGTFFNKIEHPPDDRIMECKKEIILYHTLLITGVLPLVPEGWSL